MDTKAYKKEFSRLGLRMALCSLVIMGIQYGSQFLVLAVNREWVDNPDIMLASSMVPLYLLGYPVTFWIIKAGSEKRDIEKHMMKPWQFILAFMMSYGILILGNMIGLGVTLGIGLLKGEEVVNPLLAVLDDVNLWISSVYIVLLAPAFEEYLFRKLICDRVVKYGQGTAVFVSGFMFGLFHGNFNQFFYAFFIGCFFAYIYVKTGKIRYTIGLHMIVNFIGSVAGGLLLQNVEMESVTGMIVYALYALCVYGIAITGIVLFLVNRPKMKLDAGEMVIERGSWFRTVLCNAGMIIYIVLFTLQMLVFSLL